MNELLNFALNALFAWDETPDKDGSRVTSLRDVWQTYKQRTGDNLQYETFQSQLRAASYEGWLKFSGNQLENVKSFIRKAGAAVEKDLFSGVNVSVQDAFIRHQINLLRLSGSIRNEIVSLLDATEKDLKAQIMRRLESHRGTATLGSARMKALEKYIIELRRNAWRDVSLTWKERLEELAIKEPTLIAGLLGAASPVVLNVVFPDVGLLKAIVKENPFQGNVLKTWANQAAEADIQRILAQIRIGMVNGEDVATIARRIVGTGELKGADGITALTRKNIEAITRTAVMAISHAAREEFYTANADLFDRERFVATLDSRTTPVCRSHDGKIFAVGTGPRPPIHFNCRSLRVPYFADGALGNRPARNFSEKQLLREFAEENGLDEVSSRKALPRGFRKSYDEYASERKAQLTTVVPAKEDFGTWLARQTRDVQNDILGETRGKLFRTGKLTMESFVDKIGREINLKELSKKYASVFRAAGLDPGDYQ